MHEKLTHRLKLAFLRHYARRATRSALRDVLELPLTTVCRHAKVPLLGRPMARAALRLAWDEYQQKGETRHFWRHDGRGRWSDADIEELLELVGKMPLAAVGRRLKRTRRACECMLRKVGWTPPRIHSLGSLKRAFTPCLPAVQAILDHRLRSYREGNRVYVHIDDAEWLETHYRHGTPIPKHPGKEL